MKNLFNDQRFVLLLSLFAFAYLARTVFVLGSSDTEQVSMDSLGIVNDLLETTFSSVSVSSDIYLSGNGVNREQIGWIIDPPRDPFAVLSLDMASPKLASALGPQTRAGQKKTGSSIKPGNLPVLKALFHHNDTAKAVIDGVLVVVGDRIAGFAVLKIQQSSVVVEKSGYRYTLYPVRL